MTSRLSHLAICMALVTGCSRTQHATIGDDVEVLVVSVANGHNHTPIEVEIDSVTAGLSYDRGIFTKSRFGWALGSHDLEPRERVAWMALSRKATAEREELLEIDISTWGRVRISKPAKSTIWSISCDKELILRIEAIKGSDLRQLGLALQRTRVRDFPATQSPVYHFVTIVDPSFLSGIPQTPDFRGKATIKKIIENMGSKPRPF